MVGKTCFAEWWAGIEKRKKEYRIQKNDLKAKKQMYVGHGTHLRSLSNVMENLYEKNWSNFSGLDK
jgi:hypothetical protein